MVKKIIIVGAGFGGLRAALDLLKKKIPNSKIILINNKPHFEYHPALYRVVTGRSPLEVCIPLRDIFKGKKIEVLKDTINKVDLENKKLKGTSGASYSFDFLILALGSETIYFDIPGLKKLSFGFKSINQALQLKRHLHQLFAACEKSTKEQKVCAAHIVIVGGGASGSELAGELAAYTKKLADKHNLDPSLVTVDLIEAADRLLPTMPATVSKRVKTRLQSLGVNIFLNRMVIKEEVGKLFMKDMEMKTKTVIWTAGIKPNRLFAKIKGLKLNRQGRAIVDKLLQVPNFPNVFVIGDAAATPYTGMAQTAMHDGHFVADVISRKLKNKQPTANQPRKPDYAIPVGPGWAVVLVGKFKFYGRIGWWVRRLADLRYFLSILSTRQAIVAWLSGQKLSESCPICYNEDD